MRDLIPKLSFKGKKHFFDLTDKQGNLHSQVIIEIKCTCQHTNFDNARSQYGSVCNSVKKCFAKFKDNVLIDHLIPDKAVMERRNEALNLLEPMNRIIGERRSSVGERPSHSHMKWRVCDYLDSLGKQYVTEAIFLGRLGRADVFVLDDFTAIEIADSETQESIEKKKQTYPAGVKIKVIRISKEEYKELL